MEAVKILPASAPAGFADSVVATLHKAEPATSALRERILASALPLRPSSTRSAISPSRQAAVISSSLSSTPDSEKDAMICTKYDFASKGDIFGDCRRRHRPPHRQARHHAVVYIQIEAFQLSGCANTPTYAR